MNKIITITLVLICTFLAVDASAANKKDNIYAFGFSASFNDSTVYFTDIQLLKDVVIEHKTHFLENREVYSRQLANHLADKGLSARVCVFIFNKNKKALEKKFAKLRKKYTKDGKYTIMYVGANEFQFEVAEDNETQEVATSKKAERRGKQRKQRGGRPQMVQ